MAGVQPKPSSTHRLPQAWLTEIHEYAQRDVVIMLLGNKVSGSMAGPAHPKPLPLPQHHLHPASSLPENVSWASFQQRTLPGPQCRGQTYLSARPISSVLPELWKWPPAGKAQAAQLLGPY